MAAQSKTSLVRPLPQLDALFGSLVIKKPVASPRKEKQAARAAMAKEAAREGLKVPNAISNNNQEPAL
jgi:hypothetical protein